MRTVSRSLWLVVPALGTLALVFALRSGATTSAPAVVPVSTTPATVTTTVGAATNGAATAATTPGHAVPSSSVLAAPVVAPAPVTEPDLVGTTPAIAGTVNPQVQSVVDAARSGTHPERLSPLIAPAPYDHQRFLANPQAYLDVVEPGRVFQSAAPGENVPQLEVVGEAYASIPQGSSVTLQVRSAPQAPVTFTSFECGAFSNHLTSITVQADAEGVARAVFTGTPGTLNDVAILAGSPLASGQANLCVNVTPATAALGRVVTP
jgi:hypothetical protein